MYSCDPKSELFTIASDKRLPYRDHTLMWHVVNFTPDIPQHEQILIFRDVFSHFNYKLWPLQHVTTEDYNEAYFRIAFVGKDLKVRDKSGKVIRDCTRDFNAEPNILAVAHPRYGNHNDGWIFINESYFWSTAREKGKIILKLVLIHELAHAFGLGHTDKKGEIMLPEYNPLNVWTQDSDRAINAIQGKDRMAALISVPEAEIFRESTHDERNEKKGCRLFVNRNIR